MVDQFYSNTNKPFEDYIIQKKKKTAKVFKVYKKQDTYL